MALFTLTACAPATGGAGGTEEAGTGYSTIIILVVLVVVFYFFLIRPENKRKKQAAEMRSSLGVGDTITTIGGIVGEIVSIDDGLYTIETGEDQVRLQITQWAISTSGVSKNTK
ncbi:MAG: preprotein translocase subunit YajC [Oscillospiraceae bacterium]|nr:preprotein translocase subunit YajC [Oscillospiraceae bacterium]